MDINDIITNLFSMSISNQRNILELFRNKKN